MHPLRLPRPAAHRRRLRHPATTPIPRPTDPISVTRAEFDEVCDELAAVGAPAARRSRPGLARLRRLAGQLRRGPRAALRPHRAADRALVLGPLADQYRPPSAAAAGAAHGGAPPPDGGSDSGQGPSQVVAEEVGGGLELLAHPGEVADAVAPRHQAREPHVAEHLGDGRLGLGSVSSGKARSMTRCITSVVAMDARAGLAVVGGERGDHRLGQLRLRAPSWPRRGAARRRRARRWCRPRGARWVTRRSRSSIHSTMAAASRASFEGK